MTCHFVAIAHDSPNLIKKSPLLGVSHGARRGWRAHTCPTSERWNATPPSIPSRAVSTDSAGVLVHGPEGLMPPPGGGPTLEAAAAARGRRGGEGPREARGDLREEPRRRRVARDAPREPPVRAREHERAARARHRDVEPVTKTTLRATRARSLFRSALARSKRGLFGSFRRDRVLVSASKISGGLGPISLTKNPFDMGTMV